MISYATTNDLIAWVPAALTVPDDAEQLLRSATLVVARAANRDPYTDTPTAADAVVLRDAACAQATAWITIGVAPAAAGLDQTPVKRSAILDASIEHDTAGLAAATADAATKLAPEAEAILQTAGLLWVPVPLGPDQYGPLPTWGLDASRYPYSETLPGLAEQPLWGWP